MKHTVLLFALFVLAFGLKAQKYETAVEKTIQVKPLPVNNALTAKTTAGKDTLDMYVQRRSSFQIRSVTNGGYVAGVSNDGTGNSITTASGAHFDSLGSVKVNEVYFWVGAKEIVGSANSVKVELYNAGQDSLPTNLVGFGSANLAFVDSNTTGVNFTTMNGLAKMTISQGSKVVNGPFVVAMNYDAIDDTIGLVTTNPDSGDGQGEGRFLQLTSQAGWTQAANIWLGGFDADPVIIPIVESTVVGRDARIGDDILAVRPAYPNPAKDEFKVLVESGKAQKIRFILWDSQGRIIRDSGTGNYGKGNIPFKVELNDIPSGSYYYSVISDEKRINSKIQIVK